jgi:D-alanine-D-alanine ligase
VPERGPIVLLFGGRSVEHAVSIRSAASVLRQLEADGETVLPVAVAPDGSWFTADDPLGVRSGSERGPRRPVRLRPEPGARLEVGEGGRVEAVAPRLYFPLIHGTGGEDGSLQGLLELAEAPYAGSGVLASALAMDKDRAKAVLRQAGLPVLDWRTVGAGRWRRERESVLAELTDWLPGPLFVKPANSGSSVGVSRIPATAAAGPALDHALQFDLKAVVEPALSAREIEVSVLGSDQVRGSVPGEIVPAREFYDYHAKYADSATRLLVPAPLPDGAADELTELACRTWRALDGAGFGRVDFLVERESGKAYVSEANTLPGFTDVSMFPRLWAASGLGYGPLLGRIIELGLERHAARMALRRQSEEQP